MENDLQLLQARGCMTHFFIPTEAYDDTEYVLLHYAVSAVQHNTICRPQPGTTYVVGILLND